MTSFPKALAAATFALAISGIILSPAIAGPKSTDRPTSRISNEAAQLEDNATLRQVFSGNRAQKVTPPRSQSNSPARQITRSK